MTTESLASRVDAGARLLDEKRPGWFREIAMDRLAMSSCSDCVLGQIYGDFEKGMTCVFGSWYEWMDSDPDVDSGFDLQLEPYIAMKEKYDALADLWRAEIRKRLEQA